MEAKLKLGGFYQNIWQFSRKLNNLVENLRLPINSMRCQRNQPNRFLLDGEANEQFCKSHAASEMQTIFNTSPVCPRRRFTYRENAYLSVACSIPETFAKALETFAEALITLVLFLSWVKGLLLSGLFVAVAQFRPSLIK